MLRKASSWRNRIELNDSYKTELIDFNRTPKKFFAENGLELLTETKARLKCTQVMADLKEKLPNSKIAL